MCTLKPSCFNKIEKSIILTLITLVTFVNLIIL